MADAVRAIVLLGVTGLAGPAAAGAEPEPAPPPAFLKPETRLERVFKQRAVAGKVAPALSYTPGGAKVAEADAYQELIVVEEEGAPVGCFQLSYLPGLMRRGMWRGQIEVVHVAESHRNRGIGSQMMRWALDRCRERGCGMVQLTSNKQRLDAHRFYERLGFHKSHEGFKFYFF